MLRTSIRNRNVSTFALEALLSLILVTDSYYSLKMTSHLSPTKDKGKSGVLYFLWESSFNALNLCLIISNNGNVFPKRLFLKFCGSFVNGRLSEAKLPSPRDGLLIYYSERDSTGEETFIELLFKQRERLLF